MADESGHILSPAEIVQLLREGKHDEIIIPLTEVMKMGLRRNELFAELRSGRLLACAFTDDWFKRPPEIETAGVQINELEFWLDNQNVPRARRERVKRWLERKKPQKNPR